MISENLRKHFPMLKLISQMNLRARKTILKHQSSDPSFYKAIRELAKNTVNRNIPLSEKNKRKLKKDKRHILLLVKKGHKKHKRRKLVLQSGRGFFLPVVVPIVASLIGELISRNNKNG